jgi:hypothetical protein
MLLMLTFASQTFANGTWTLTPEEPTSLQLALLGFGALVIFAAMTGWRTRRTTAVASVDTTGQREQGQGGSKRVSTRRAA